MMNCLEKLASETCCFGTMKIQRIESDLMRSNMYLVEENGHAMVIDPCRNTDAGQGLTVDRILLTHEHYDHISGVNAWKERFQAPVLCSEGCAENIKTPKRNMVRLFDVFFELQNWVPKDSPPHVDKTYFCTADMIFREEIRWQWQGHSVVMFSLPGHSLGSSGILMDDALLFSGDSLLKDKPVELRLPGGSEKLWKEISLPRLEGLPDEIRVFPGHFSSFPYRKETSYPETQETMS